MNKQVPRRIVTSAVVASVSAVLLAAPAHADQYDFVAQLDNRGV